MINAPTLFYENGLWHLKCLRCDNLISHKHRSIVIRRKYCGRSCQLKDNGHRIGHAPTNRFTSDDTSGQKNINWKGDDVGYYALHDWVTRKLGRPSLCENCGESNTEKRYEWASISGTYKRDLLDWKRLCKKCHYNFDGIDLVLDKYQKRKIREIMSNNKSGFKNVILEKKSGRYYSYIATKGHRQRLGTFDTPEEAYEVYKQKALELFGRY